MNAFLLRRTMHSNYTQNQSPGDEQRSRLLSLKNTQPPAEIAGYSIQRFLGAGAYGEVWVARDRNTGRQVAIKFYAHRRGVDWSLLSREVEKLVFLSADRYVVQLLEVGWDADPPFYVMEFIESGSLEDLLSRSERLSVHESVDLFREICVGLAHAHGKGVLHCDLKPANILLDHDRHPRLADFGQSRLSHEQTPALGTLFYMAPEQADLSAVPDVRWDVYALGAILFTMIVGEPPHRTDEIVTQIDTAADLPDRLARYRAAIASAPRPQLHRSVPHVDRALAEIVDRALAADPEERYASVQELLAALESRAKARQMRPMLALGLLFPLVMLLVAGVFGWQGYRTSLAETESLATQRALENNQFAARLASEQVAGEVERIFRIAEDEASRPVFDDFLHELLKMPEIPKLAATDLPPAELLELRARFLADPRQDKLEEYLARRLKRHQLRPKLASIFVLDAQGTQLAAAHEGDETSQSVGRNFAFRAYFHGGNTDLDRGTRVPTVSQVGKTHLSTVFQSSTSKKWKVAIATPLYQTTGDDKRPVGVFVITMNLGDFEFFKSVQDEDRKRFAVLVDGRGENAGVILQHPLFDEVIASGKTLPESFREERVKLQDSGTLVSPIYVDPLASDPLGTAYQGTWLATSMPVRAIDPTAAESTSARNSGLVVLVQENYQAVIEPVQRLASRLVGMGALALVVLLLASSFVWLVVLRLLRPSKQMNSHSLSISAGATAPPHAVTLPQSRDR